MATVSRRRKARWLTLSFVCILLVFVLSLPAVSGSLMRNLETMERNSPAVDPPPRAVVILSAGLYHATQDHPKEEPDFLTLERLQRGARIARERNLPILVTGGRGRNFNDSLARVMQRVLSEDFGLDTRWVEERSKNTQENATRSAEILTPEGIGTIVLVTHGWHMPRAREAFERAGFSVVPEPVALSPPIRYETFEFVPHPKSLLRSYYAVHEHLGRLWYRIRYY